LRSVSTAADASSTIRVLLLRVSVTADYDRRRLVQFDRLFPGKPIH
jgi:hypothetical protein